jgi:ABC-type transporter Mla subunit MlaD
MENVTQSSPSESVSAAAPAPASRTKINVDIDGLKSLSKRLQRLHSRTSMQLDSLIEALADPGGVEGTEWAGIDVYSIFGVSEIAHSLNPHTGLMRIVEMARNISIFAPLVVTWYHLSTAGDGADFVKNIGEVVPGVLVTLLVIIVLTVLSDWAQHVRESSVLRDEAFIARLFRPVSLYLHNARVGQPSVIIEELRTMAAELRNAMTEHQQSVRTVTKSQVKELEGLQVFSDGLMTEIKALKAAGESVSKAAGKMNSAVDAIDRQVQGLSQQLEASSRSMQAIGTELRGIADQQKDVAASMNTRSSDFGNVMQKFDSSMQRFLPKFEQMSGVADSIVKVNADFLGKMADFILQQKDMVRNIGNTTSEMAEVVQVIGRLDGAVSRMGEQTKNLVAQLNEAHVDTQNVLNRVDATAKVFHKSAEAVQATAQSQDQIAQRFQDAQKSSDGILQELSPLLKAAELSQSSMQQLIVQMERTQREFREQFREYVDRQKQTLDDVAKEYLHEKIRFQVGDLFRFGRRRGADQDDRS